jgi:hypothetical protein
MLGIVLQKSLMHLHLAIPFRQLLTLVIAMLLQQQQQQQPMIAVISAQITLLRGELELLG